MKYSICIILILLHHYSEAQVVPVQGVSLNPIDQSIFRQWASEVDNATSGSLVEGSPYLFNEWAKGEITTIKEEHHSDLDLKFNLFTGQIIYKNPFTKDSTLIMSKFLTSFQLQNNDTTFLFHLILPTEEKAKPIGSKNFYLILLNGKNTLLAQPKVKIKRATQNSLINSDGQLKDRYNRYDEFYLKLENDKIITLKRSKKSLIKSLEHHHIEMKKFLKETHLDLSNPTDLTTLVKYYNAL